MQTIILGSSSKPIYRRYNTVSNKMPEPPEFLKKYLNITAECSDKNCDNCNNYNCPDNDKWECPEQYSEAYTRYINSLIKYFGWEDKQC